jgi:hypothetical protein
MDNRRDLPNEGGNMTSTLLDTTLRRAAESRSFHILAGSSAGWEATELRDQRMIQRQHYADWHRVERALAHFAREIDELRERGWCEA